jgi:ERCC4-related helicase
MASDAAHLPAPAFVDPIDRFRAFLNAMRWGAASSADVKVVHAPFHAGIEIEDYQLDPLVRAIRMPRVSLLIADDVGLGKTIEAGMVAHELMIRQRVRSVLVLCPASLQIQWKDQMRDKFGLDFRIVDSDLVKELRRRRGLHVNPWAHFPRLITSFDYLKRERILERFAELFPTGSDENVADRRFDLLIVDEAHHMAPAGRGKYAVDSLRTAALRRIAPQFEHRIFLSATPHNGFIESFTALLELLDDLRFMRMVEPNPERLAQVMVRRLKSDLPAKWDGTPRFPKRAVVPIEVAYADEEKQAHALLRQYTEHRLKAAATPTERAAVNFVLKLLKKRLFSSPRALANTLEKHLRALKKARSVTSGSTISKRQIARFEEWEEDDDEAAWEENTSTAISEAADVTGQISTEDAALLAKIQTWAERAAATGDSKFKRLVKWLEENLKPNGKWNDRRVIIFSEYRDTQKWLADQLSHLGFAEGGRLVLLHGGMTPEDRETVKHSFQAGPQDSTARILLATDAASEGIDLQNHCADLIHYEIPWNPNRLEQRNGRVDRHGQRAHVVNIYHFVGHSFAKSEAARYWTSDGKSQPGLFPDQVQGLKPGDLEGDLEFLMIAAIKVERIREDLGKVGPVLADQVSEAMLGLRRVLDTAAPEKDAAAVRKAMKVDRDIKKEVAKLAEQLQEARVELGIAPEAVRQAVDVALELAGQPALRPFEGAKASDSGKVWALPQFKGSWSAAHEGVPHPHTRKMRPVTFEADVARGRDDVVHLHLNHRLVQMALRLLRAEGWAAEDRRKLARFAICEVPTGTFKSPVIVAYGRLVILGADQARLHESLVTAGVELLDGKAKKIGARALESIFSISELVDRSANDGLRTRISGVWSNVAPVLEAELKSSGDAEFERQRTALAKRADAEVEAMNANLDELAKRIKVTLNGPEQPEQKSGWYQPELFNEEQKHQWDVNLVALAARLERIPADKIREVAAIRRRFADPSHRLFPVAAKVLIPSNMI